MCITIAAGQKSSRHTHTYQVPQRHLPLANATEASAENLIAGHKDGSDRPAALVRLLLLLQARRSQHHYDFLEETDDSGEEEQGDGEEGGSGGKRRWRIKRKWRRMWLRRRTRRGRAMRGKNEDESGV